MKRRSLADAQCPVARTLDIVGDPWTLLIVRDAMWGRRRFNEFQESLGIPRTTLTSRLALLVDAGVFTMRTYQDNPVRHEYVLTEKGRSHSPVIISLMAWGDRWGGFDEPPVELVDRDDGHTVEPVMIDRVTGRTVEETRIRMRRRAESDGSADLLHRQDQ